MSWKNRLEVKTVWVSLVPREAVLSQYKVFSFVCFSFYGITLCPHFCHGLCEAEMYYETLFSVLPNFRYFFKKIFSIFFCPFFFFSIFVIDCLWTSHFFVSWLINKIYYIYKLLLVLGQYILHLEGTFHINRRVISFSFHNSLHIISPVVLNDIDNQKD